MFDRYLVIKLIIELIAISMPKRLSFFGPSESEFFDSYAKIQ